METIDSTATTTEKALQNLNQWLDKSKEENCLADLLFCPKELNKGNIGDYIEEAQNMLRDYERGRYIDITDKIL